MAFNTGQKIGSYRIVRFLGEGGMGAVYEVEHEKLGVRYARAYWIAPTRVTREMYKAFETDYDKDE